MLVARSPYTDVKSFVALSEVLEGVGMSFFVVPCCLFSSSAQVHLHTRELLNSSPTRLTSPLQLVFLLLSRAMPVGSAPPSTRARDGVDPLMCVLSLCFPRRILSNRLIKVPLDLNEVFSLAAPMIKSCPPTNPTLPVKAFPALTIASPKPGSTVSVTFDAGGSSGPLWVAFFTGLDKEFVEIKDGQVTIPSDLLGTVYAVVTTSATDANDDTIIAGPAILTFDFDSNGKLIQH